MEIGLVEVPGTDEAFERELAQLPRNDTRNAERFIRPRGQDFFGVKEAGGHGWDGKRWNLPNGEVLAMVAAQGVAAAIRHDG